MRSAGRLSFRIPTVRTRLSLAPIRSQRPLLPPNVLVVTRTGSDRNKSMPVTDIEDLHATALKLGSTTYVDPFTGFTVFTELAHLHRGVCCGSQCRHCPYGWTNVPEDGPRRDPKVESGNKSAVQALLKQIEANKDHKEIQRLLDVQKNDEADRKDAQKTGGRHGGRLTTKNVPYTRTGDLGQSMLLTGERRSKADVVFEAMGTVDELCSIVGVVHAELQRPDDEHEYGALQEWLLEVMSRLFDIGSHVAKPKRLKRNQHADTVSDDDDDASSTSEEEDRVFVADGIGGGFDRQHIHTLEDWIDQMTEDLPELLSFILPTGAISAAQLHNARCVCRRAERRVVPLVQAGICDPNALKYLNRLSDFFFSAARWVNYCQGLDEYQYRKPSKLATQRGRVTVPFEQGKPK
jgi:cob(I)alamin adenosyltransferase